MMKKIDNISNILGVPLDSRPKSELLITLVEQLQTGESPLVVFTPNPEQIVQSCHQPKFFTTLHQANLLIPDGIGLVWASRLLASRGGSQPIRERIPGVDVAQSLLAAAAKLHKKALLLGGRGYQNLPSNLLWDPGYSHIANPTQAEEQKVAALIAKQQPAIVFVAFGAPYQEQWAIDNLALLKESQVKIVMVVGGAFDFLLGKTARAPQWMQTAGLEWLFRLYQEPWRWRRQLRLVEFCWLITKELLR